MKKLLMSLVCLFALVALVACGQTDNGGETTPETTYKLGLGTVVDLKGGESSAEINATVAAVVLDKDGKILACRLDVAQNKISTEDGVITKLDYAKTKMEKGTAYGMSNPAFHAPDNDGDGRVLEWDAQAKAFEEFIKGMTATEVAAMTTQTLENGYVISDNEELLAAGCTIQIDEFKAAVVKACNDEQGVTFAAAENFTLGLAITSFEEGKANAEDEDGNVKIASDMAASVVVNGKIAASLNDAIQTEFTISAEDYSLTAKTFPGTKRERKTGYGMSNPAYHAPDADGDGRILEWNEQSLAFSKHVVGMTGEQVANMETAKNSIGYDMTTDSELLAAGCTIQITAIKAVVAKSVTNAR